MAQDLIRKLEKAKGPTRELDIEVARAFGAEAGFIGQIGYKMRNAPWLEYDTPRWVSLPDFTSSLSDAIRHLAGGKEWSVCSNYGNFGATIGRYAADFKGKTPAMAICIAALKHRAAQQAHSAR